MPWKGLEAEELRELARQYLELVDGEYANPSMPSERLIEMAKTLYLEWGASLEPKVTQEVIDTLLERLPNIFNLWLVAAAIAKDIICPDSFILDEKTRARMGRGPRKTEIEPAQ